MSAAAEFAEHPASDEVRWAGLSSAEATRRAELDGPNEVADARHHPLLDLLGYFWGPVPWMIEAAAILSAVIHHWTELIIVAALLFANAAIGYWDERKAGNAVARLREKLAPVARVRRDQQWRSIPARELVVGDLVHLRIGDIVPADVRLAHGSFLSLDQSALTGESLPVSAGPGNTAPSGAIVQKGDMEGIVTAIGAQTSFGKTAKLVSTAGHRSHLQMAVLEIGRFLIAATLVLVAVLVVVNIARGDSWVETMQFALVLTVAAVPVAMPAVLSATMAVGALKLSAMRAIVSRLDAVAEMAGMDVLCSDKTGTLTRNQLTVGAPVVFDGTDEHALLVAAAAASEPDGDAIDRAIRDAAGPHQPLTVIDFTPFDPVSKRAEATVQDRAGASYKVTKGAPQVVLDMCVGDSTSPLKRVRESARRGYRTLAVARTDDDEHWHLLGLVPLLDPPREDAAKTVEQARAQGIDIKMITGDHTSIATEVARALGLGDAIVPAANAATIDQLEAASGFAEAWPEHKHEIVSTLQEAGHIVGMTGDGVNDAPALQQADIGVAVSGATDAARAAAAVVLTAPGLSVIVRAVEEARRVFSRMTAYAIYRVTETLRIMLFMVLAMLAYGTYPITPIMIILLALLNDLPIIAITGDHTLSPPRPQRWQLRTILVLGATLGVLGVAETFLLLVAAHTLWNLSPEQTRSLIFLKLVVAGHLTLLVARTRGPFWSSPRPAPSLLAALLGTQLVAAAMVGFGWMVTPLGWSAVGGVWLYCLIWFLIEDRAKIFTYRILERTSPTLAARDGRSS